MATLRKTALRNTALAAIVAAAAIALAACGGQSSNTPSPTVTSASPSSSPTTTSSGSSTSQPVVAGQCPTSALSGSIGQGTGGAAGSTGVTIVLTNTGSSPCSLQGWPGTSFVGDGNGTQLGQAAAFDRSTPHPTVQLAPGGTAVAPLKITEAGNYDQSQCQPKQADGFRIYPPGNKASLFIADANVTACQSNSVNLLTVGALNFPQ
jgi:hypothetical protein